MDRAGHAGELHREGNVVVDDVNGRTEWPAQRKHLVLPAEAGFLLAAHSAGSLGPLAGIDCRKTGVALAA